MERMGLWAVGIQVMAFFFFAFIFCVFKFYPQTSGFFRVRRIEWDTENWGVRESDLR